MVKLASWRREQGLTVPALAVKLGASCGAITKWERGERLPRRAMMRAIVELTEGRVKAEDLCQAVFEPPQAGEAPPESEPEPPRGGPVGSSADRPS